MTASNINQFQSKRRRQFTDDFPSPNVDMRLKLMGEALKSRMECEIEAFCSNIQSLVLSKETHTMVPQSSPPQRVPRKEIASHSTDESSVVPVDNDVTNVGELNVKSLIETESEDCCNQDNYETIEQLHSKFISLTLRLINSSVEKRFHS